MITSPPNKNEVEVTVIGTGGGYGESIVIKASTDSWIIVDSCIHPVSKEPLSIHYLKTIGVDLNSVELIICTHWHNDHIKGLHKALLQCPNAEFCFSNVNDLGKFLYLCDLDYAKVNKGTVGSTDEFAKCCELMLNRGQFNISAYCNSVVFVNRDPIDFVMHALSPSPKTINDFNLEISNLITEFGENNTAMLNNSPNDKSVALQFSFGNHRVILGADLEIGDSEHNGWRHVLKNCLVIDKNIKSNLYKIPHHGSNNGYLKEIFDVLINKDGILKITPYNSSGLPREEMIKVYKSHSVNLFSTSLPKEPTRSKKREMSIEKFIDRMADVVEIKFNYGIIRSRIDYTSADAIWDTELFESACKI